MAKVQFKRQANSVAQILNNDQNTKDSQGINAGLLTRKMRQSGTGGKEHKVKIYKREEGQLDTGEIH